MGSKSGGQIQSAKAAPRAWLRTAWLCVNRWVRTPLLRRAACLAAVALILWASWIPQTRPRQKEMVSAYGKLPLSFELNRGQAGSDTKFLSRGGGYTLALTERGEPVLALSGRPRKPGQRPPAFEPATEPKQELSPATDLTVLRLTFPGGNPSPRMEGEERLSGHSNYLLGNDPQKWLTHVPHFARVRYREVYPGVDVLYYGRGHELEYDFLVQPGADPRAIRIQVEGAQSASISQQGNLVLNTPSGRVVLHKPVAMQGSERGERLIECSFTLSKDGQAGFTLGEYDAAKALRIDPVLSYAAQIDGEVSAIAVDSAGNTYVAGRTGLPNFPTTAGVTQPSYGGAYDAFVAKLDSTGTNLLYATYLGGSSNDAVLDLALDSSGNLLIAGSTGSANFPATSALQSHAGGLDAFVAVLNPAGTQLLYSTFLGGQNDDVAAGIAVDSSGSAYVTGKTYSCNFPVSPGAFQVTCGANGNPDAFVAKLDPSKAGAAALVFSTFLGGSNYDEAFDIALDSAGNSYVTGSTGSANFPTAGPLQGTCGSCAVEDAFVAKLNATGTALIYSTFLGGSSWDRGYSIAVDAAGNAFVAGETLSNNFPTTAGAMQTTKGGSSDAFVTKVNSGGTGLVYSSFIGGLDADGARGIALDSAGNAYLTGFTYSTNFPVVAPLQATSGAGACNFYYYYYTIPCADAIAPQMNAAGSGLVYSTYLGGGQSDDKGSSIAVDSAGNAYIGGIASSWGGSFPFTPGGVQMPHGGGFAAKISPQAGPGFNLSMTNLDFPRRRVNTSSPAQIVLVRNVGSAALSISGIATSGSFSQTNNCGSSVAAGGQCSVSVTFTPASVGPLSGTLTITHNAAGSPHSIPLTGTGASDGVVSFDSPSASFAAQMMGTTSAPLVRTLTNTGTGPLGIASVTLSGDFAQTNNCSATIAPNASCQFSITFSPASIGQHNDRLNIAHDGLGSPFQLSLFGVGTSTLDISPTVLQYFRVAIGTTTAAKKVTLTNVGSVTINLSSIATTTEFAQTNTCPAALAPAATCEVNVSFTPQAPGPHHNDFLIITSDAPGSPQRIPLRGHGRWATTTSVTSSGSPAGAGQAVTFTALVTPSTATGTVCFLDGQVQLGCSNLNSSAIATFTTSNLSVGSHSISASYMGNAPTDHDGSLSSVLTQTILVASTTTITSSLNPSTSGQAVTFTATVSPPTATGTVDFLDGGVSLGTAQLNASRVATLTTSALTAGSHSITAAYAGNSSVSPGTSAALAQTVKMASSVSVTSSSNPSNTGQTVTFTATVSPASATGTVTFLDGNTALGTAALNNGSAAFASSTLVAGNHSVTASYAGDANVGSSTSAALTQTISGISLISALTNASVPSGGSAVFSLTVVQGALSAPITFSCAGLPAGASCTFNPATVSAGNGPTNVSVAINVGSSFAFAPPRIPQPFIPLRGLPGVAAMATLVTFGFAFAQRGRMRFSRTAVTLGLMLMLLAAAACGGGGVNNVPPAPVQLQVTVNAVSGGSTASTVFSITVQR